MLAQPVKHQMGGPRISSLSRTGQGFENSLHHVLGGFHLSFVSSVELSFLSSLPIVQGPSVPWSGTSSAPARWTASRGTTEDPQGGENC